jgi:hypothetical protein
VDKVKNKSMSMRTVNEVNWMRSVSWGGGGVAWCRVIQLLL